MGLYDTVAAIGDPYDGENGLNLTINTDKVGQIRHVMMASEFRRAFDLISFDGLFDEKKNFDNIKQRWFLGAHSNGGGGYGLVIDEDYKLVTGKERLLFEQGKMNTISQLTRAWMTGEAFNAGAPISKISGMDGLLPMFSEMTLEEVEKNFVHNSSVGWKYFNSWFRKERTIYSPFKGEEGYDASYEDMKNEWFKQKYIIIKEAADGMVEGR